MADYRRDWVKATLSELCALISADGYSAIAHTERSRHGSVYLEVCRPRGRERGFTRTGLWLRVADHRSRAGVISIEPGGVPVAVAWARARAKVERRHQKSIQLQREKRLALRSEKDGDSNT